MGFFIKKSKSSIPPRELQLALAEASKCGCGIDCCYGYLTLPNYNSNSGDVDEFVALYVVDGVLKINDIPTAKNEIKGYQTNSLVSATGVVIEGCPEGALQTDYTVQLAAVVNPSGALQTGTWTSSVPTRATVSNTGLVTSVGESSGPTTIKFVSTDGAFEATCIITVI
ncbi:MAG: Ig-like domain-containing protein [Acetoanaerobium sp.]|nr:Ig-like domain-containing protein [Acetoanaerobium sp.]